MFLKRSLQRLAIVVLLIAILYQRDAPDPKTPRESMATTLDSTGGTGPCPCP